MERSRSCTADLMRFSFINNRKIPWKKFSGVNRTMGNAAFKAQFLSSSDFAVCIPGHLSDDRKLPPSSDVSLSFRAVCHVGNLQAFIRYIWQINDPLSQVSQLSAQVQSAFSAMGRIFTLLQRGRGTERQRLQMDAPKIKGNVTFDHVSVWLHRMNF